MYKDIMASTSLDSPYKSSESRKKEIREHNQLATLIDTPIRNDASNIIALRKHDLIRRQKII